MKKFFYDIIEINLEYRLYNIRCMSKWPLFSLLELQFLRENMENDGFW